MKIVCSDYVDLFYVDLSETYLNELQKFGEVVIYQDIPTTESEIVQRISGAEIITVGWINVTSSIIKSSPSLKYIIVSGVGYDNVDITAATTAGIKVINSPKHNTLAVAEYTMALILNVTKQIIAANTSLKNGSWNTQNYLGIELNGKNLGLIGYGNIAQQVAKLATNFGMNVSYANSQTPASVLDQLIAKADILSLHLPLTKQSKHLIDERRLNLMKKSAYLINTARGSIVDQKALLKVLKAGHIAGAALDVFENEPLTAKPSPEILQLAQLDNVVATPHIAYNTEETAVRLSEELLENILACIKGNPINVVN
jgi:phosphoglycerate dehydrogenase-like enzyme